MGRRWETASRWARTFHTRAEELSGVEQGRRSGQMTVFGFHVWLLFGSGQRQEK